MEEERGDTVRHLKTTVMQIIMDCCEMDPEITVCQFVNVSVVKYSCINTAHRYMVIVSSLTLFCFTVQPLDGASCQ